VPTLAVQGDSATVGYAIYQPGLEAADQAGDGAIAVAANILRELCGPDFTPSQVLLARREPGDIRPFRRFFRAPLRFQAEQNAVVFPSTWLNRRLPAEEPELRRMLQRQIEEREATHRLDFPEQVRRVLRSALLTGTAGEGKVAALFGMQTRTLHRRLRAFDTSFSELVDESRYAYACQMLRDGRMEAGKVAVALGYSEPSAFTRAFRRWSGTTPSAWRSRIKAGGPGHR
jgi:AraC-like DNA-binding protein